MKLSIGRQIALLSTGLVVVTAVAMWAASLYSVTGVVKKAVENETEFDTKLVAQTEGSVESLLKTDLTFTAKRMAFQNVVSPELRKQNKARTTQDDVLGWLPDVTEEFLETKQHYVRLLVHANFAGIDEKDREYDRVLVGVERESPHDRNSAFLDVVIQVKPRASPDWVLKFYHRYGEKGAPFARQTDGSLEAAFQFSKAKDFGVLTTPMDRDGLERRIRRLMADHQLRGERAYQVVEKKPENGAHYREIEVTTVDSEPLAVLEAFSPIYPGDPGDDPRPAGVVVIDANFGRLLRGIRDKYRSVTRKPSGDGSPTGDDPGDGSPMGDDLGDASAGGEEWAVARTNGEILARASGKTLAKQSSPDFPFLAPNSDPTRLASQNPYRIPAVEDAFRRWENDPSGREKATAFGFGTSERKEVGVRLLRVGIPRGDPPQQFYVLAEVKPTLKAKITNAISLWTFSVALLLVVGGAASALFFGRILTRPLKNITHAAESLTAGNFDVVLPADRTGEIGVLTHAFQTMIDHLRQRRQELRDREARLSTILNTAAEGIVTTDEHGNVEVFNQAAESIFECSADEVKGRNFCTLLVADDGPDLVERFRALVLAHTLCPITPGEPRSRTESDEVSFDGEASDRSVILRKAQGGVQPLQGRRRDGAVFPLELSVSEAMLGERRTYTAIVRDVTERKQAIEKIRRLNANLELRVKERTVELERTNAELVAARDAAEEANRAKDSFVASVSHELRTPLNHIGGYCQLLELTELDDDQQHDLLKIRGAGNHLLALINDILDYQKIIMGVMPMEPESFDLGLLLRETAESMTPRAEQNGNRLELSAPADLGVVFADRRRLSQMLLNLLSNACKFTHDKKIHLRARREPLGDVEGVVLEVQDEGKGMSPAQLAKLFQPFEKLSDRADNPEGTGLGLVITRGICRRMGGDVTVSSTPGVGATFTIRIPAHFGEKASPPNGAASIPSAVESLPPPTTDGGMRRILVIDDDPSVGDLMKRFLEAEGFEVRTATNGLRGLEMAKEIKPEAVILDVVMPGLDGWAVLAALKTDEETADVPVVMVTMIDEKTKGFSLGANDYLTKPVNWERLANILHKQVGDEPGVVLVVDDQEASREVLRRMLIHNGWTVAEADNGRTALERMAEQPVALVILDLMMPTMDGFEFVDEVRKHAESRTVPIVVVTAKSLTEEDRERLSGRVVQVVKKGMIDREQFLQDVHRRVAEFGRRNDAPRKRG